MHFLRRALRMVLITIVLCLSAVLFYLLVIMGDTRMPDQTEASVQAGSLAGLSQSPLTFSGDSLHQAEYYFNAPVLTLGGQDWQPQEITVWDRVPEGVDVSVREICLRYVHTDGTEVWVSSLTPARCLRSLPERGFVASIDQDWMLAGVKAVLMSNGRMLHLHVQKGDVVYQIEGNVDMDALRKAAGAASL